MEELLKNYNLTVNPKRNDRYELCKLISDKINRPIGQVMKLTQIFTLDMLQDAFYESEKGEKYFWIYRLETCNPPLSIPLKK